LLSVVSVVLPTVRELLFDASTHLHPKVFGDGEIPVIE